jgi:hypothetical protein
MKNNSNSNRREFLKTTGKTGVAAGLSLSILPALAKNKVPDFFPYRFEGNSLSAAVITL